jgi:hypothetical protein
MTKGLKKMVSEALTKVTAPPPVKISGEAHRALAYKMREWSGWNNARLEFGRPSGESPFARTNQVERLFTVNVDALCRNPHRVIETVTPFRLRQEAVLTGVMLHEAGHARHSHWLPRTSEEAAAHPLVHGSGSVHEGETPTKQTVALARLLEEPRVEGLIARGADRIGANGLAWTMRASSADLLPMTALSADPNQQIMDLIESWTLRAGKQVAYAHWTPGYRTPDWVADFNSLLSQTLTDHLVMNTDTDDAVNDAHKIVNQLVLMAVSVDDRGTYMIDSARDILDILFPETAGEDDEDQPMPGAGCATSMPADGGTEGESDEEGEQGEGNTEPEDEGSGDDPGAGDSGEDEAEPEQDEQADGASDSTDQPEHTEDGEQQGGDDETDTESDLAKALAEIEASSKTKTEDEAQEMSADMASGGLAGGNGESDDEDRSGWRRATKEEREIAKGAEHFLRGLIEPSEAGKLLINDAPSSVVDGAAYSEWRKGGMMHEPRFFKHIRRTVEPSPPVKIAVLVDVSGSMDELQEPSAVLSWALASAALDLRNFAGRGVQIESTLIHWGDDVSVIQKPGEVLPGLREFNCWQGTSAMHEALDTVADLMPGFFDASPTPVNRLIVQFTDWELWNSRQVQPYVSRALESGVNMLTVAPTNYSVRRSSLPEILKACRVQRGKASLMKYNPMFPSQVWDTASEMLDGVTPAPFAGF